MQVRTTSRFASGRNIVRYSFKGKDGFTRINGAISTSGCLTDIDTARVSVVLGRGMRPSRVKNPADVALMGVAMPETVVLDASNVGTLQVSASDPTVLVVPLNDPLALALVEGAVLVVGRTSISPYGMLRKISHAFAWGSSWVVVTTPATLDDAFYSFDLEIGPSPGTALPGLSRPMLNFDGDIDVGFGQTIRIDIDDQLGQRLTLGAGVDLAVGLSLGIHTGWKYKVVPVLKSAHAELSGEVSVELLAAASNGFSVSPTESLDLVPEFPLGFYPIGPVVITPTLGIAGNVEGHLEGGASILARAEADALVGFRCEGFDCGPVSDFNLSACDTVTVDAGASIKPYLGAELTLLVNEVTGPSFLLEGFTEFEANTADDPWWRISVGVDFEVALSIDLHVLEFEPFSHTFEVGRIPIAEASGPFDGIEVHNTCETVTHRAGLLANGDFSQGNSGFVSDYVYSPFSVQEPATYCVVADATNCHQKATQFPDHTGDSLGLMMVANGAIQDGMLMWSESVPVEKDKTYIFAGWATTWSTTNDESPPVLFVTVDGQSIGADIPIPARNGLWTPFSVTWVAPFTGGIEVGLGDRNLAKNGNDPAIDDLCFGVDCHVTTSIPAD